ncbi:hypothetical protein Bbelb_326740 [Branchiostoma belcheri]|nr:hypothetical protein Bbelb_326740 [Branchiostoma belcheri]
MFACVGKVFSTKDRFACVWKVFGTKDRFTCVWKVFSTKDRFACMWKVFSTKDRFACVWKVFGTKDRFACVWKVFSTKDRFACVWKVFSTKDRFACVWKVFSTKDRFPCVEKVFSTKDRFSCVWKVFSTKDRFTCVWKVFSTKDRFTCVWKVFSTKDRFACVEKVFSTKDRFSCVWKTFSSIECLSKCAAECLGVCAVDLCRSGDVLRRKCGFPDLANFGEDRNGETVGKNDLKTEEEYQVAADLYRSEDYCLNLIRQIGPEDLKTGTEEEYQKTDWTRPDELKAQEKYQKPVMTVDFCVNQIRSLYLSMQLWTPQDWIAAEEEEPDFEPARDLTAARPNCKSRSAPYHTPHGSRRATDRAPDGSLTETGRKIRRTLGVMTPAGVYAEDMPNGRRFKCDLSITLLDQHVTSPEFSNRSVHGFMEKGVQSDWRKKQSSPILGWKKQSGGFYKIQGPAGCWAAGNRKAIQSGYLQAGSALEISSVDRFIF